MIDIFSNKIQRMIQVAYETSRQATHSIKIGCVIFDKKIISKGYSCGHKTTPHLDAGLVDKMHSEMMAIRKGDDVTGATLVVVRGTIEKPTMARPCRHCYNHIKKSGIKTIIYSTNNGFATERII